MSDDLTVGPPTVFTELAHARDQLHGCVGAATRNVRVFSPELDQELFGGEPFLASVSAFVRRAANAELQVLIRSASLIVSRGHRFLELARRLDSKIRIRRVPAEYARDPYTFAVIDAQSYWLMPDSAEYVGDANLYDPITAKRLEHEFQYLWERSVIEPELRRLHV